MQEDDSRGSGRRQVNDGFRATQTDADEIVLTELTDLKRGMDNMKVRLWSPSLGPRCWLSASFSLFVFCSKA